MSRTATTFRNRAAPRGLRLALAALLSLFLIGCSEAASNNRAVFVLLDISNGYAQEREKVQQLSAYLLSELGAGDSLAVAFIDNSSFTERNIIAQTTFDARPSVVGQQKRAVLGKVQSFMEGFETPSYHSDITGGILLGRDYLHGTNAERQHLFVLSDLHEDLPPELNRDMALDLAGIRVVALNVLRQRGDNNDPAAYHERLASWKARVEEDGGRWQVINELERLPRRVALR
ncbi:VWA domain-containing protein [Halovibrio salipaludis]|uniref:VWA domain-containing protein n=1 Tax=Halovibrio salipaludis TaxID=2032626 RepID=UPI0018EA2DB6|nr:VWA domain-containing protein [Halovibrio salipaludis]